MIDLFHPDIAAWFARTYGAPTPVQTQGWAEICLGNHALLSAPTGTGKTLAAFLPIIDRFYRRFAAEGYIRPGLHAIYISPLRSLANDMRKNLVVPLNALGLGEVVRIAVRNSDTPQSERTRITKNPPHILITTPESLFILLTSDSGRAALSGCDTVIIDELHAIIDSKRGTHLALSLERLCALTRREVRRVGVSATMRPLEDAAAFLGGYENGSPRPVSIVAPITPKRVSVQVTSPVPDMRTLPEGTIWPEICKLVYELSKTARTTLVFLNHRAPCEKVAFGVNALHGGQYALTHHGCVSREQRLEAEMKLKSGELKLLCATSSMELGIDVGEVDLVLQVACPPTVASGVQRLGRAGHAPGAISVMHLIPRTAADTLLSGIIARGIAEKRIERAEIPMNCLDVLAQHAVSMAASGEWAVTEMLSLAKNAYPYRDLTDDQLTRVLKMLYGDYEHDEDKPVRPRLMYDRINGIVRAAPSSRLLAILSGGTIPDRGYYKVTLSDGTRLGELDEVFVYESRLGDKFTLGAFSWRIEKIERDRIVVTPATPSGARSPFWIGDWQGVPYELGLHIGRQYAYFEQQAAIGRLERTMTDEYDMSHDSAANAARLVREQIRAVGCLQTDKRIVIEQVKGAEGAFTIIHLVYGGRVNLAIMMLLEEALAEAGYANVQLMQNETGIYLNSLNGDPLPRNILAMLPSDRIPERIARLAKSSPLFAMTFRYNASRALMMGMRKTGRVPLWLQRVRSDEALERIKARDDHPLNEETLADCTDRHLDIPGAIEVISGIHNRTIDVFETVITKSSPMAIEFKRMFEGMEMYEEDFPDRTRTAVAVPGGPALPPQKADIVKASGAIQPTNAETTHAMLMTCGDFRVGDMDLPLEWLTELSMQGRAIYRDPGLWIAAEHAAFYDAALDGSPEEMQNMIRRCLRYRGAYDAEALSERYAMDYELIARAINYLESIATIIPWEDVFVHKDVYERASGMRRAALRQEVQTAPPEGYAAYLTDALRGAGQPEERLREGMEKLTRYHAQVKHWEEIILPARTQNYAPRMLDGILASGEYMWRILPNGELTFDLSGIPVAPGDESSLSPDEYAVLTCLRSRGALHAHAIARMTPCENILAALTGLLKRGLITNDTYAPVRALLIDDESQKRRAVKTRVTALSAGRFSALIPTTERDLEPDILAAFARYGILCRETALKDGLNWPELLNILRVWEYTGRARRGYFVRRLSGAQFTLNRDARRIMHDLQHPSDDYVCLSAIDPVQPYGGILPHVDGRSFMQIPSTAVVFKSGRPALIAEKHGANLRTFEEHPFQAINALVRAYKLNQIFKDKTRIVVKDPAKHLHDALKMAGFAPEMNDFTLWR